MMKKIKKEKIEMRNKALRHEIRNLKHENQRNSYSIHTKASVHRNINVRAYLDTPYTLNN